MPKVLGALIGACISFWTADGCAAAGSSSELITFRDLTGEAIQLKVRVPSSAKTWSRLRARLGIGAVHAEPRRALVVIDWDRATDSGDSREIEGALSNAGLITATLFGPPEQSGVKPLVLRALIDRPRRLMLAVDHLFSRWHGRHSLDPSAVAVVGRGMGGFAALVAAGAAPDGEALDELCFSGQISRCSRDLVFAPTEREAGLFLWTHTPMLTKAVVVDPTVPATFTFRSLSAVRVPLMVRASPRQRRGAETDATVHAALPGERQDPSTTSAADLCATRVPLPGDWDCYVGSSRNIGELAAELARFVARDLASEAVK
jgi:pimeloyl-ACP methyl ester carboxylesterase